MLRVTMSKGFADYGYRERGICRKAGKAKACLGSSDNICATVANAECYLNYEKHSFEYVLIDFDSRCISAFFVAEKSLNPKELRIMSKNTIFTGAATALITPLNENGIDFENFGKLIDWQIEQGIDALVICGTTGEASTLNDSEHKEAIRFAAERIAGRVPMIAGTGGNDTAYAIELTKYACSVGADACLVVTPYYNKATQNGLVKMFTAIADASTKPLILYNIPSRTGVNIGVEAFKKLMTHPNIAAVKEASGNLSQCISEVHECGEYLDFYSGNDDQILPILSLGGKGVISVLSNVLPKETSRMVHMYLDGDLQGAQKLQIEYLPLINALFSEVNPIPVKAAMSKLGFGENYVRMPLTPMEDAHAEVLYNEMRKAGLDV